jgi:signal transduction histidine kinase
LHDTVLQGFVGVVYQLEAALRHFDTAPKISRGRLERAVKTAEAALRDGRKAITNLRLPTLNAKALPEVISDIGSEVTADTPVRFSLQVKGTPTPLSHEVEANVSVIAREAIWNAVTHARPGSVSVRLEYSPDRLTLAVQDDGSGFDTKTAGDRQNRFGLVGMRERAKEICAEFRVDSEIGRGTTIELTTPVQRLVRKALTR